MNALQFFIASTTNTASLDSHHTSTTHMRQASQNIILTAIDNEERAANHALVDIQFLRHNRIRLITKPTFDITCDTVGLAQIMAMIRAEGYTLVSLDNPTQPCHLSSSAHANLY